MRLTIAPRDLVALSAATAITATVFMIVGKYLQSGLLFVLCIYFLWLGRRRSKELKDSRSKDEFKNS